MDGILALAATNLTSPIILSFALGVAAALAVLEEAADVCPADIGQLPGPLRIEKRVGPVAGEQRLVGVHPRAVDPLDRFRHEGGVQTVLERDSLDHQPEGGDVVGGFTEDGKMRRPGGYHFPFVGFMGAHGRRIGLLR